MKERFRVGVISSVHGIRGEAKVFVTADSAERFLSLEEVTAAGPRGEKALKIESVKFYKNMAICKFAGIDTPEEIRKYMGNDLLIPREKAIPLEKGEFYIPDLIGLPVFTEEGRELGTLKELFPTGANYVMNVEMKNGKEVLIPYIADCVKGIDPLKGRITVRLLDGLL